MAFDSTCNQKKNKIYMKKIAPIAGLATCFVLYSVIIIAALPYIGEQGETYSVFNHFISELGSVQHSYYHYIYNNGLIIASLGFALFTYGIGAYSSTKMTKIAVVVGVISSILCVGVGLVPEDYRLPHLILAFSFFCLMALAATLFSWSIWREEENPFPKYTALHGFLIPISFLSFISMPKDLMAVKRLEGPLFNRPEIWWLPFLEWVIFAALTSWILVVSLKMLHLQRLELTEQEHWDNKMREISNSQNGQELHIEPENCPESNMKKFS